MKKVHDVEKLNCLLEQKQELTEKECKDIKLRLQNKESQLREANKMLAVAQKEIETF